MNLSVCGLLAQFRPYIQHYLYIGSIISFDRRVQPPPTHPQTYGPRLVETPE